MPWLEALDTRERLELPVTFEGIELLREESGWRAALTGSGTRLTVDGRPFERVSPVLRHLDELEARGGRLLRFLEWLKPRRDPLELAIIEEPGDSFRWHVWADLLAERGDARAPIVRGLREQTPQEIAERLGPLTASWRTGNLELTWRHGFIHSATRRSVVQREADWTLADLLRREAAAFLEHLHVDLFGLYRDARETFPVVLRELNDAPPSLRSVTIGPVPVDCALSDANAEALARLRDELPRLRTTAQTLLLRFRGGELRTTNRVVEPVALRTHLNARLSIYRGNDALWLETHGEAAALNGNPCVHARLLHGDLIEHGSQRWTVSYL